MNHKHKLNRKAVAEFMRELDKLLDLAYTAGHLAGVAKAAKATRKGVKR